MKIVLSWLLFTAESAGAPTILWNGVPIHRRLLLGHTIQQADPSVFVLGAVAVILIQSAYWIRLRCLSQLQLKRQLVLGHAIQFLGRLSFVFIGEMFSVLHPIWRAGVFFLESLISPGRPVFAVLLHVGFGPIRQSLLGSPNRPSSSLAL